MSDRNSDRTRGTSTYRQALLLALTVFLPPPLLRGSRRAIPRGDGAHPARRL